MILHCFFFIVLTGLVMGNALWSPGAIALLDYQALPQGALNWYNPGGVNFPAVLSLFFGVDGASKIFFIIILWLSYMLWVLLTRQIAKSIKARSSLWGELFFGIFFIANPFAYERMLTQPVVFLGIILIGYIILGLLSYHHTKKYPALVLISIAGALSWYILPHAPYMILLVMLIYALFLVRSFRELFFLGIAGMMMILPNLIWLLAPSDFLGQIDHFHTENYLAFMSNTLYPFNVWGTNLLLYGFWGERAITPFVLPGVWFEYWYIFGILMISMALCGIVLLWRHHQLPRYAGFFMTLAIFTCALGVGIASGTMKPVMEWGYAHLPLFNGFREPQKWIGILMIMVALGLMVFFLSIQKKYLKNDPVKTLIMGGALLLCLTLWSPGVWWWYRGQLETTLYPQTEFSQLRQYLSENPPSGNIVIFPWHHYYACKWTGGQKSIADPAVRLLAPIKVISNTALQVGGLLHSNRDARSQAIEAFIRTQDTKLLAPHHITHILAMKDCGDIASYEWLSRVCALEKNSTSYALFRCQ